MPIMHLDFWTLWQWAAWLMFRMNLLPPFLGSKWGGRCRFYRKIIQPTQRRGIIYILYKTLLDVITYCCLCYNHCYHFMNCNNITPPPSFSWIWQQTTILHFNFVSVCSSLAFMLPRTTGKALEWKIIL